MDERKFEPRESFIFYRSYFEAIEELKPTDQAKAILAIMDYALNGNQRELKGVSSAVFRLIKPNIDSNQTRFENGKKGGRPKANQ